MQIEKSDKVEYFPNVSGEMIKVIIKDKNLTYRIKPDGMAERICGANLRNKEGRICMNKAGHRTDHQGIGRCWLHGGVGQKIKERDLYQIAKSEPEKAKDLIVKPYFKDIHDEDFESVETTQGYHEVVSKFFLKHVKTISTVEATGTRITSEDRKFLLELGAEVRRAKSAVTSEQEAIVRIQLSKESIRRSLKKAIDELIDIMYDVAGPEKADELERIVMERWRIDRPKELPKSAIVKIEKEKK